MRSHSFLTKTSYNHHMYADCHKHTLFDSFLIGEILHIVLRQPQTWNEAVVFLGEIYHRNEILIIITPIISTFFVNKGYLLYQVVLETRMDQMDYSFIIECILI